MEKGAMVMGAGGETRVIDVDDWFRDVPASADDAGFLELEQDVVRRFVATFSWLRFDRPSPRNPLPRRLSDCRIGLIATAGAHLPDQRPMGPKGEIRPIPLGSPEVRLSHPGYDTDRAGQDPEVVFPQQTLMDLAAEGTIGSVAPTLISSMGFIPDGKRVLGRTAPEAVSQLRAADVDLALLVPA
jgi:D-proline reductase (dithiol) PrdB